MPSRSDCKWLIYMSRRRVCPVAVPVCGQRAMAVAFRAAVAVSEVFLDFGSVAKCEHKRLKAGQMEGLPSLTLCTAGQAIGICANSSADG